MSDREWMRHPRRSKRSSARLAEQKPPFRRGAALVAVLAALAMTCAFIAAGGARVYGIRQTRQRADRQARLRAAVWNAAWTRLCDASLKPQGGPGGAPEESPDGVKTAVVVERIGGTNRAEPARFALTIRAELEKDRREAWSLAERNLAGGMRILVWVER